MDALRFQLNLPNIAMCERKVFQGDFSFALVDWKYFASLRSILIVLDWKERAYTGHIFFQTRQLASTTYQPPCCSKSSHGVFLISFFNSINALLLFSEVYCDTSQPYLPHKFLNSIFFLGALSETVQ